MREKNKILLIAGAVILLTVAHYLTAATRIEFHDLFRRLYFVPVIYAAYEFGLRGGLLAALFASVLYLPFVLLEIHGPSERFDQILEILLFNGLGIITGILSGKQKQTIRRLEKMTVGVIQTLVTTIEARDAYTKGHSVRVMKIATILGRKLGLPPSEMKSLEIGALFHDIGKIALDLAVLNKPAALSDRETDVMKKHPEWGLRILESIDELHSVLPTVLRHHERFDGSGYPGALKREEIPLLARIVSVADVFDAMTTNRPYKIARSWTEAIEELKSASGSALDPRIVELFVSDEIQDELKKAILQQTEIHSILN